MERTETEVTPQVSPPVTLAVTEHGSRTASTHLVLLHGFPDDQTMWDDLVGALPRDWHVVTYDARGTGRSSRPTERRGYLAATCVGDLLGVLDATVPEGQPVHLVGHDWGSVIGWEAVAGGTWDPAAGADRVVHLDQRAAARPPRHPDLDLARPAADAASARAQHLRDGLPAPLPARARQTRHAQGLLRRIFGLIDPTAHLLPWGPEVAHNSVLAVNLYRANRSRLGHPQRWRTSTPVLLVVPRRDGFITPRALTRLVFPVPGR